MEYPHALLMIDGQEVRVRPVAWTYETDTYRVMTASLDDVGRFIDDVPADDLKPCQ